MKEKITQILEKEGFAEKLFACEEPEQVQAMFAAEGVELSLDEVVAIGKALNLAVNEGDELNEDDLDAVAGGSIAGDIVEACVTVYNTIKSNWRAIKNWFRRW